MTKNRGIRRSSESGEREGRREGLITHQQHQTWIFWERREREREQKHISVVKFFVNNQHFQKRSIHQTPHHHRQNTLEERPLLRTHTHKIVVSRGLKREERSSTTNITLSIGVSLVIFSPPFHPLSLYLLFYVGETKHHPFPPTFMFCSLENCVKEREERKERGERKRERERERKGEKMVRSVREEKCV